MNFLSLISQPPTERVTKGYKLFLNKQTEAMYGAIKGVDNDLHERRHLANSVKSHILLQKNFLGCLH